MIPMICAVIAFLFVEWVYVSLIYNLEAGSLPAVGCAFLAAAASAATIARLDQLRDSPQPVTYDIPVPVAFAAIKRSLKTFSHEQYHWRINYDDKQRLEVQASMNINADCTDIRWLTQSNRLDKSINVLVSLSPMPDASTEISLRWKVFAPYWRDDCNEIIHLASVHLDEILLEAETSFPSSP